MNNIIVATSIREQQDIVSLLKESLKVMYLTDTSISIVQRNLSKVDVYHSVKGMNHLAASYTVVLISVSMSLDKLNGYSPTTNININRLLAKLDSMKEEVISFVNAKKVVSQTEARDKEAFKRAAKKLFD